MKLTDEEWTHYKTLWPGGDQIDDDARSIIEEMMTAREAAFQRKTPEERAALHDESLAYAAQCFVETYAPDDAEALQRFLDTLEPEMHSFFLDAIRDARGGH